MANESLVELHDSITIEGLEEYWVKIVRLKKELQAKTKRDLFIRLVLIGEARLKLAKGNQECPICGRKFEHDQKQTATVPPSSP